MTVFETINKKEIEFGNNNFLQVARKVAKSDGAATEFIALTRGYLDGNGARRYKTNLTLPPDAELVEFIQGSLEELMEDGG